MRGCARLWLALAIAVSLFAARLHAQSEFAYVANRGGSNVSGYTINPTTGALTPIAGSPLAAGATPVTVTVDPSGKFAYVANFSSNNVSGYTIDPGTGALTGIAAPFPAGSQPLSVAINPLVPFASSFAKLEITAEGFDLKESFTLATNSNGINPVTENVTLKIGTFSVTHDVGGRIKTGHFFPFKIAVIWPG